MNQRVTIGMKIISPPQKRANFPTNRSQNNAPPFPVFDATIEASITSAKNREIIEEPTLRITLGLRPRPKRVTIG